MELTEQIKYAADIIRAGGTAAFPTETVYGLGANALDETAVARIFEIKRRPRFDPLIVHIENIGCLNDIVADVPPLALELADKLWPGPLTLVLQKKSIVPDIVTSGLPGVAVRIPSHDIARQLIELAGVPIAAPSANPFGGVSPTTARHVRDSLGGDIDVIIDGGQCSVGIESTVISFMTDTPALLRPGGTPLEDIEAIIGKVTIPKHDELTDQSPGRSERHYATTTPLILADDIGGIPATHTKTIGLLTFMPYDGHTPPPNVIVHEYLSKTGDLKEAACNLFATMRRLDKSGVSMIVATPVPHHGLGRAINDRLFRGQIKN